MLSKIFGKKLHDESSMLYRRDGLLRQMDFLLDTLEINKFDLLYMDNLKNPMSPDERIYFLQQIDRIESAKRIVLWMRDNASDNSSFWKRLLKW